MTPDTIITAEILAGLDKCPFCGAVHSRIKFGEWASYECLSSLHVGQFARRCRSIMCEERERDALRARVKELEISHHRYETVRKMNASEFGKLLQRCVFQDLKFDDELDKMIEKGIQ